MSQQNSKLLLNKTILWLFLVLISIVVIGLAFFFQDKLREFRSLGLLGIFLANFFASATIFIPAPGIATVFAGGSVYPPILVGIVATLGAVMGDMGGYIIGFSGKSIIKAENRFKKYTMLISLFRRWGGVMIFIFALIPNPLFDAIGLIAGALGYPVQKFFVYLFLGRIIRNMLLSFLGHQLL